MPTASSVASLRLRADSSLRGLLIAGGVMLLLQTAYHYPHEPGGVCHLAIESYLRALAWVAGSALGAVGEHVTILGSTISGRFSLSVVRSCSALDVQALYVGAILGFSAPRFHKLAGISVGIAIIALLNVLRMFVLYWVGAEAPDAFDAVHEEWMPLLLVAACCGLFLSWLRWSARA